MRQACCVLTPHSPPPPHNTCAARTHARAHTHTHTHTHTRTHNHQGGHVRPQPAHRQLHVPGPHGRGQDGAGQGARSKPVQHGGRDGAPVLVSPCTHAAGPQSLARGGTPTCSRQRTHHASSVLLFFWGGGMCRRTVSCSARACLGAGGAEGRTTGSLGGVWSPPHAHARTACCPCACPRSMRSHTHTHAHTRAHTHTHTHTSAGAHRHV
jgi:hypothetical protein